MPVDRVSIFLLKCVPELFSASDASALTPQWALPRVIFKPDGANDAQAAYVAPYGACRRMQLAFRDQWLSLGFFYSTSSCSGSCLILNSNKIKNNVFRFEENLHFFWNFHLTAIWPNGCTHAGCQTNFQKFVFRVMYRTSAFSYSKHPKSS